MFFRMEAFVKSLKYIIIVNTLIVLKRSCEVILLIFET
jgi:hypothetical protein